MTFAAMCSDAMRGYCKITSVSFRCYQYKFIHKPLESFGRRKTQLLPERVRKRTERESPLRAENVFNSVDDSSATALISSLTKSIQEMPLL